MPKFKGEEVVRVFPRIYAADHQRLMEIFGSKIGESAAIRTIVRAYLKANEANVRAKIDALMTEGEDHGHE